MARKKVISIILPAHNEATVISEVLSTLDRALKPLGKKYTANIIVVNDGSKDNTSQVVAKNHPKVHLINHVLNSGAGAATRTGLNVAKKLKSDLVVTMDSDGQHNPLDVIKTISEVEKGDADFIIGSRLIETKGMPWYRIMGNKGLSFITYLVFGVFVKDSQSGLKALNSKALDSISYNSNHYAFCSEMIWAAHRKNLIIKEIPIEAIYSDYSLAKGQSNWGAIIIIRQIIKRRLIHIFHG